MNEYLCQLADAPLGEVRRKAIMQLRLGIYVDVLAFGTCDHSYQHVGQRFLIVVSQVSWTLETFCYLGLQLESLDWTATSRNA